MVHLALKESLVKKVPLGIEASLDCLVHKENQEKEVFLETSVQLLGHQVKQVQREQQDGM